MEAKLVSCKNVLMLNYIYILYYYIAIVCKCNYKVHGLYLLYHSFKTIRVTGISDVLNRYQRG